MASLDNLSDGEIRVKLTELGYPVGPITATTRKVLIKKLKYLLDQSKSSVSEKPDTKNRQSLSRYSSGEESEDDRTTRNRRSMPPPPPKSAQKTVKRKSLSRRTQEEFVDDDTVNSEFSAYPTASSTLNSSDILSPNRPNSQKYSPKNILSPSIPNYDISHENKLNHGLGELSSSLFRNKSKLNIRKPRIDAFDTGSDTDGIDEVEVDKVTSAKASSNVYSSFIPSLSGGTRSRFQSQSGTGLGLFGNSDKFSIKSDTNNHNSPFSSDFVKRLSAVSSRTGTHSGLSSQLLDVKESDDEETSSSRHNLVHQTSGYLKRGSPVSTLEGNFWKNTSTISRVLLFVVVLFFCGLGVVYMSVRFKETPITLSDMEIPLCKMGSGDKPGATCILQNEVQPTLTMFRELYQVLHDRAVLYACGGDVSSSVLKEEQLSQLLVTNSQMSVWDVEKHFGNMKVLIKANPQWGVEVNDKEFNIPSPELPLTCHILTFFYGIVGSAFRFVIVIAVLLALGKGYYWWQDRQERNQKEVFKLVESIIDVLSTHQQSSAKDNYLAISHVRDQLIPPQQRDKMAGVWEKAVAYLEENESRVRSEVQQLMGEEFRVWRWLPAPRSNGKRKVWQGQAFETMEGSVNSLTVSPTPCLKVRHMFDSDVEDGEDWVTRVQDAILEKCDGVNVLHIAVDKNSNEGCVYVKCASPQDAGRAYRALHGSWFDSKLVTVKYLRLERYHERFPEAARCLRPMRPSNDRKLSLQ